jgi:hypothetical protein
MSQVCWGTGGCGRRFVVIGGFAVGAHGYPRTTKDLDIVPDPDPKDLAQLATVPADLNAAVLGREEFAVEEFGHRVRFCGYEHLVAMKEAAGRPEDLIDLQRLREARQPG